jgi:hypothetical protein
MAVKYAGGNMAGKRILYLQESANHLVISRLSRRGYKAEEASPGFGSKILAVSFQGTHPQTNILVLIDPKLEELEIPEAQRSAVEFLVIVDTGITAALVLPFNELETKLEDLYEKLKHVGKGRLRFSRISELFSTHESEWLKGHLENWEQIPKT